MGDPVGGSGTSGGGGNGGAFPSFSLRSRRASHVRGRRRQGRRFQAFKLPQRGRPGDSARHPASSGAERAPDSGSDARHRETCGARGRKTPRPRPEDAGEEASFPRQSTCDWLKCHGDAAGGSGIAPDVRLPRRGGARPDESHARPSRSLHQKKNSPAGAIRPVPRSAGPALPAPPARPGCARCPSPGPACAWAVRQPKKSAEKRPGRGDSPAGPGRTRRRRSS